MIHALIKQRREALGWSQAQLAERMGMSTKRLGLYERGQASVSAALAFRFATVMESAQPWLWIQGALEEELKVHGLHFSVQVFPKAREVAVDPAKVRAV